MIEILQYDPDVFHKISKLKVSKEEGQIVKPKIDWK